MTTHTYCHDDPERLNDPPTTNDPVVLSPRPAITAEQRRSVLLDISATPSECLEIESSTQSQSDSPFGMEHEQNQKLISTTRHLQRL